MRPFVAPVSAAFLATGLLLSTSGADAAFFPAPGAPTTTGPLILAQYRCYWVKEDSRCWGDTCRMRKVCSPAGPYRPGMSTRSTVQRFRY